VKCLAEGGQAHTPQSTPPYSMAGLDPAIQGHARHAKTWFAASSPKRHARVDAKHRSTMTVGTHVTQSSMRGNLRG